MPLNKENEPNPKITKKLETINVSFTYIYICVCVRVSVFTKTSLYKKDVT